MFGHVFENMVLRDLLVYAEKHNARLLHYTDDTGLEADAVYQMAERRGAFGFRHINCQWPECLFRSDTGFFIYTYHRTARNDH